MKCASREWGCGRRIETGVRLAIGSVLCQQCAERVAGKWGIAVRASDLNTLEWAVDYARREMIRNEQTGPIPRSRVFQFLAELGIPYDEDKANSYDIERHPQADRQLNESDRT